MRDNPKRALITGASSGIGATLAARMAKRGTEVWLCARRREKLAEVVQAIESAGGKAHAVELDVRQFEATYKKLRALDAEVEGFDLVVANAGIGGDYVMSHFSDMPWESTTNIFETNLMGAVATINAVVPGMVQRRRGQVVGVSSIAGDITLPRGAAYGASKRALTFYLESADIELRAKGVPVTVIEPGFVQTDMAASLKEPTPFMVGLERAVDIIDSGIQRRARMIRFPFPLTALTLTAGALPRAIRSKAIRIALGRRPKTARA